MHYYSIFFQSQPLNFGQHITACLPIAQLETFTGKLFLCWLHRMPFIFLFKFPFVVISSAIWVYKWSWSSMEKSHSHRPCPDPLR
jgi:hypothetical protein